VGEEAQNSGEQTRSVEGRGMRGGGAVHEVNNRVLQGLSGMKIVNLNEVGLGWINGGRKD